MRHTGAGLIAAISLSLAITQATLAAQPGCFSGQTPFATAYQSALSGSVDDSTPPAPTQEVLASYDAEDAGYPADNGSDVDVGSGLANRISIQKGAAPEVIGTPMGDAAITDGPLVDGPVCCAPACCCPCPCWTFSAGAIFLNQNSTGNAPVLSRQNITGAGVGAAVVSRPVPLQNANQFDPGTRFGYYFDAIRHNVCGSCWDVEARYFGINRWSSSLPPLVATGGGAAIPFILPVRIALPGQAVDTTYQSLLQSAELNGRRNVNPWLQLIAGVRYIAFDDYVNYAVLPITGATRFSSVNTRNNLIGPQAGANIFLFQGSRFGLQTFGKGGIYGNVASNNVSVTQFNGAQFGSSANGGHTSFVGEIGVTGTYRLTKNWGFRSTYEMLWLNGVARAPDQIAVSNPVLGTGSVASNSSLFFYGAFLGLEYNR